jgi:hypothetical protein
MLRSRFFLPIVVALLLSTLALADSMPVSRMYLHRNSVSAGSKAYSGDFSTSTKAAAPAMSVGVVHPSNGTANTLVSGPVGSGAFNGNAVANLVPGGSLHGTIVHKEGNWALYTGTPLATPEPGSLMLLSTGLIGIAGALRRRIRRS